MCLMSLTLIARLATRRDLGKGNIIITTAAVSCSYKNGCIDADIPAIKVISIAQNVITHLAVDYGLGRHRTKISTSNYYKYSKACITHSAC